MRRSEAAALDVADLRFDGRGLVVTLRRSKTDQTGEGREIAVPFIVDADAVRPRLCENGSTRPISPAVRCFGHSTAARRLQKPALRRSTSRDLSSVLPWPPESKAISADIRCVQASSRPPRRPKAFGSRYSESQRTPVRRDSARVCAPRQRLRGFTADCDNESQRLKKYSRKAAKWQRLAAFFVCALCG
jgi:hypothetical protein